MPAYEVLLHGRGLKLVNRKGEMRDGGVYAWRFVFAENEESAVTTARENLLSDRLFVDEIWDELPTKAQFGVEEIREGSFGEKDRSPGPVFYIEEDEEEG